MSKVLKQSELIKRIRRMLLYHIVAAIDSRETQTYGQRQAEIIDVVALVKSSDFLPRFILIPVDGDKLVSLPLSEITWQSIKRDASDLFEAMDNLINYEGTAGKLATRGDVYNILACKL
jgi:hypothetical protein